MSALEQQLTAGIGGLYQVVGQNLFLGRQLGPDLAAGAALWTRIVFGSGSGLTSASWPWTLETPPKRNESARSIETRIIVFLLRQYRA